MIRTDGTPTVANRVAHDRAAYRAEQEERAVPCTCTLACEPRGITADQTCRMDLANVLVSDDPALD